MFGTTEVPLYLVELEISEVKDNGEIIIRLSSDDVSSEYSFLIDGNIPAGYRYIKHSGQDVYFQKANGTRTALHEYFVVDPVIVRYSDGTYSYNCYQVLK